jgi:hypothetical protein
MIRRAAVLLDPVPGLIGVAQIKLSRRIASLCRAFEPTSGFDKILREPLAFVVERRNAELRTNISVISEWLPQTKRGVIVALQIELITRLIVDDAGRSKNRRVEDKTAGQKN